MPSALPTEPSTNFSCRKRTRSPCPRSRRMGRRRSRVRECICYWLGRITRRRRSARQDGLRKRAAQAARSVVITASARNFQPSFRVFSPRDTMTSRTPSGASALMSPRRSIGRFSDCAYHTKKLFSRSTESRSSINSASAFWRASCVNAALSSASASISASSRFTTAHSPSTLAAISSWTFRRQPGQ